MILGWFQNWVTAGLLLVGCVAVNAAQAVPRPPGPAQLRLTLEADGGVSIYFMIAALPDKPSDIESAVSRALGLQLRDSDWDLDLGKRVSSFYAKSAGGFSHGALSVQGQVALAPLEEYLIDLAVPSFTLDVSHPRCAFSRCSMGRPISVPQSPSVDYTYSTPVGKGMSAPVQFEFGYRTADVVRILVPLLALALVPIGVTISRRQLGIQKDALQGIKAGRFLVAQAIAVWLLWSGAIYGLGADLLAAFTTRCESAASQITLLAALLWLPGVAIAWAASHLFEGGRQREVQPGKASAGVEEPALENTLGSQGLKKTTSLAAARIPSGALSIRMQASLILPSVLAATGIWAWRQMNSVETVKWLAAAGLVTIIAWGSLLWTHADELGLGSSQPASDGEGIGWRDFKRRAVLRFWFAQLGATVLFPALMIALIRHAQFEDTTRYLALFGVLIFSALLLLAISNFLPALGLREWQIRLRAKLGREGVDPGAIPGNFVAFVRAGLRETPASPLDGEMGWVFLAGQRLCFLGIQTRFGLELGSIRSIQTRPVFFGWWPAEQIVLAVRDGPEPGGSPLTLWPADFRSVRQISPKAAKLAASLQSWHEGTALPGVEPPELANLPPLVSRPDLGAVSGRVRHRMNSVLGLTVTVLIAWMVCVLAHFPFDLTQGDEGWAMLLLAGAAGLFHSIPSWRARSGQLRPGKNLDLPRSTGNRATT